MFEASATRNGLRNITDQRQSAWYPQRGKVRLTSTLPPMSTAHILFGGSWASQGFSHRPGWHLRSAQVAIYGEHWNCKRPPPLQIPLNTSFRRQNSDRLLCWLSGDHAPRPLRMRLDPAKPLLTSPFLFDPPLRLLIYLLVSAIPDDTSWRSVHYHLVLTLIVTVR